MTTRDPFTVEVLVDFVDDVLSAEEPITKQHLDAMMALLAKSGVKRVIWGYYADGRSGFMAPYGFVAKNRSFTNCLDSYHGLGNPLREATLAAHRHGLEIHAYYKPYETGPGWILPEGSTQGHAWGRIKQQGGFLTWMDPFVVGNQHLRIKHKDADLPQRHKTIHRLRLYKNDAMPTRITKEHLQIRSCKHNYVYQQMDVDFDFNDSIEHADHDIVDVYGNLITRKGDDIRVLTLSGLELTDPYVLVTTDFKEGTADFQNTGTELLKAFDADGNEILGVFAPGALVYGYCLENFHNWGLLFDNGFGNRLVSLDVDNAPGNQGMIAFMAGRNAYLNGALCETEPDVQAFWLACIEEILSYGVDGIDIREENHSCHTDFPEEYGYNECVLKQCNSGEMEEIARVRGNAYTDFLRKAKERTSATGKTLRYNLNMDWFRPDPPSCRQLAYPANINFDWKTWLAEGLLDAAVLRSYHLRKQMLTDDFGQEIIDECQKYNLPVTFNHHVFGQMPDQDWFVDEFERVKQDKRFAGITLYEICNFMEPTAAGSYRFKLPTIERILGI